MQGEMIKLRLTELTDWNRHRPECDSQRLRVRVTECLVLSSEAVEPTCCWRRIDVCESRSLNPAIATPTQWIYVD
ncbi:MAG: hypothetical protein DWH81_15455 [Planctomycetota bacterium]|nr:MAG: hypothetical protein DWH81_15455 [Planctomycetota bacterium]